ncbi:hypothetical protein MUK42_09963 [Musa troglodytarum]|uniref:Uncharacterized protein n=1 Tax=Musa troglodytarum TaxID=320322 RepID=A0A9E7EDS5_9LILI|nr:hypothetical protein MUK42_09963 [Musa troglodytarum]
MAFSGLPCCVLSFTLLLLPLSIAGASVSLQKAPVSGGRQLEEDGFGAWRRFVAELPSAGDATVHNNTFVLAAERTYRQDPMNGYQPYTGGWNIRNQHYWASVSFTAIPLFAIAVAWFLGFGIVLLLICCCYCCCRRRKHSYSRAADVISLILLVLLTCAAIAGSAILYQGQGRFHKSTSATLDYVVRQANLTVDNLQKFSGSLADARNIGVDQIFLPTDMQSKIDVLHTKINTSATALSTQTSKNSKSIHGVLDAVVVGDACLAMDEWVDHPHAHTSLDDILPCVDVATAAESMQRSKQVTFQLVNLVNQVIGNISNSDFPPTLAPLYYNQSGPPAPPLCNPYLPDMSNRTCLPGEVDFNSASKVWKGYVCQTARVGGSEVCTTVGRITPSIYYQMTAAANVSHGLYYYGPFLAQLADCTFVRETFAALASNNCPGLDLYSEQIFVGLVILSAAVMFSSSFWMVYARERRHRRYNKQLSGRERLPLDF